MRYFGFMPNDFINGEGVCVSVWMAGCPHHCSGCHNQHMWNYEDGYEVDLDTTIEKIIHAIPFIKQNNPNNLRITKKFELFGFGWGEVIRTPE